MHCGRIESLRFRVAALIHSCRQLAHECAHGTKNMAGFLTGVLDLNVHGGIAPYRPDRVEKRIDPSEQLLIIRPRPQRRLRFRTSVHLVLDSPQDRAPVALLRGQWRQAETLMSCIYS